MILFTVLKKSEMSKKCLNSFCTLLGQPTPEAVAANLATNMAQIVKDRARAQMWNKTKDIIMHYTLTAVVRAIDSRFGFK